ncbi:MAG TPA: trigger factor, partial [Clostridiales bacterium]|nr:trigger factor [Clostridiales bacterium]
MGSTVVKKEKNEVTLKIEVGHEQFEKAVQQAYQRTKHKYGIAGFRRGKAPRKLIEAYYGEGVFYDEAINLICPEEYEKAIKDQNLEPVDRPTINIEEIGKGKNLVFTATVTVKPELVLGQYKGIEAEKKEYNVKEEDVEKELEMLRDRNSRMVVVERPIQEGDYVLIDYKGFLGDEEEEIEGATAQKQGLWIGSGRFIPGFEEQLIGAKAGDDVTVKVKFPEDYHVEKLKGQDAVFYVKINEVKEKQLPELDDEFAKDVSEHDTLEALKEDIRKKQEEAARKRSEYEFKNEVLKKVIDNAQVDIPEVMVENQIDNMLNDFDFQLRYQGMDLD